jgi:hypothetical protein
MLDLAGRTLRKRDGWDLMMEVHLAAGLVHVLVDRWMLSVSADEFSLSFQRETLR